MNIVRKPFNDYYASSISRPFELAAFKAAIVSCSVNGIETWFKPNKELIVVNNSKEAIEVYDQLLDDYILREELGIKARDRVIKEHTVQHRAKQLIEVINSIPCK